MKCDETDPDVTCSADMEDKIKDLYVDFFYLNTNFDGGNIATPLVNYLVFKFNQGLEY